MVHIRAAVESDIVQVAAIYGPAVATGLASFELEVPSVSDMVSRFQAIVSGGYPYLVAEAGGQVLGYAYASAYRTRPGYRFTVEDSIYVAPAAQGKRVGSQLLDALLAACEQRGFRLMIAVIGDSANAASINLHRRAGFHFAGTLHSIGWKHGRWLDSVMMEKALGAGDASPGIDAQLPLPLRRA